VFSLLVVGVGVVVVVGMTHMEHNKDQIKGRNNEEEEKNKSK